MTGGVDLSPAGIRNAERLPRVSVIVDYGEDGRCITAQEAEGRPELTAVLARLKQREAEYASLLSRK